MRGMVITALAALVLIPGCSNRHNLAPTGGTASTSTNSGTSSGTSTRVSLGSGSVSSFQPGVIAITTSSLSAGGSSSLQVTLLDQTTGTLYTTATTIAFTSPCETQGLATIVATPASGTTPASASVTTTTGTATATYTAAGCTGSDAITASATA